MAVSDSDVGMHAMFRGLLPEQYVIDLPENAESAAALARFLERHADELAGIIVEPLVQGAGGMRFHDPPVLRRLRDAADRYQLLLIFDEIFTGFGRTGTLFASETADITPDIVTLSKALTGGTLPLAATVARARVFDEFWSDDPKHALMHGPTFMANALACAAANASLDLFESEPRLQQVAAIASALERGLAPCRDLPGVKGGARKRRDRSGRARAHRRSRRVVRTVPGGGGLRTPVRLDRLSHPRLHDRRGGTGAFD